MNKKAQAQKHKRTQTLKHKHNISNTIAQIQKIQNQNSNPNQVIDTNNARISTSFKISASPPFSY